VAEKKKNGKDTGTRNLVIGMILLVVLVGAGSELAKNRVNTHATMPSSVSAADGYGISFNPKATVKVDFYEDFQCPNCRNFEAVNSAYINRLVTSGKIHAVFHPMSFIGPESIATAAASACAADQGKFLEYHTALYENQGTAENSGTWNNQKLILLGHTVGIKSTKFDACVNNGNYVKWTSNIEADASSKNINSTPTVLINGKVIPPSAYLDQTAFSALFTAAGVK